MQSKGIRKNLQTADYGLKNNLYINAQIGQSGDAAAVVGVEFDADFDNAGVNVGDRIGVEQIAFADSDADFVNRTAQNFAGRTDFKFGGLTNFDFGNVFLLSMSAFNVLVILQLTPQRQLRLNEISRLLLFTKANISFLVKTLERKGLIEIVPSDSDKRARQLKITKAGEELLEQVLPAHIAHENGALATLSVEEKETLRRLLAKINAAVEAV